MGTEENPFLTISISGIKYVLPREKLKKYPGTLLADLADSQPQSAMQLPEGVLYNTVSENFYAMRSPNLFDLVVHFYATGNLHIPTNCCINQFEEELEFWKIDKIGSVAKCCFKKSTFNCNSSEDELLTNSFMPYTSVNSVQSSKSEISGKMHRKVLYSKIFEIISVIVTILSIGNIIVASLPNFQTCASDKQLTTVNASSILFSVELLDFGLICKTTVAFLCLDALCALWFTLELLFRFFACTEKRNFMKNPLNVVDMLSVVPLIFELIVLSVLHERLDSKSFNFLIVLHRILQISRIARLLKLFRYSSHLQVLARTFSLAKRELLMLVVFTSFSLLIFATLLYYIEKDEHDTNFSSIPASCWWAIVTLTTAGYGDVTPHTACGKVVAGVACVSGILIMALPISVLVDSFNKAYGRGGKGVDGPKKIHDDINNCYNCLRRNSTINEQEYMLLSSKPSFLMEG